jgi:hypothetical protein
MNFQKMCNVLVRTKEFHVCARGWAQRKLFMFLREIAKTVEIELRSVQILSIFALGGPPAPSHNFPHSVTTHHITLPPHCPHHTHPQSRAFSFLFLPPLFPFPDKSFGYRTVTLLHHTHSLPSQFPPTSFFWRMWRIKLKLCEELTLFDGYRDKHCTKKSSLGRQNRNTNTSIS